MSIRIRCGHQVYCEAQNVRRMLSNEPWNSALTRHSRDLALTQITAIYAVQSRSNYYTVTMAASCHLLASTLSAASASGSQICPLPEKFQAKYRVLGRRCLPVANLDPRDAEAKAASGSSLDLRWILAGSSLDSTTRRLEPSTCHLLSICNQSDDLDLDVYAHSILCTRAV